jgi:hypothetical protein
MSADNGYAEPFKQLLEVSRQSVAQSTEQTLLLRQLVESLKDVEDRHKDSTSHTRALALAATKELETTIIAEMRSGEGWWRKAVIIIGVITALSGAGSVARAIELFIKH